MSRKADTPMKSQSTVTEVILTRGEMIPWRR